MSLLSGLFGKKTESPAYRRKRAAELHGLAIRYVTERRNDNDDVVGKGGSLTLRGDEFLVFSSGDVIFRTRADEMDAAYLMSGDGVILTAPDYAHDGVMRTVTAHFVYYRK